MTTTSEGRMYQTGDVIDAEHNTRLDDPDLIAAIIEASVESPCGVDPITDWSKVPRDEQIALQLSWVEPMPSRQ